MSAERLQQILNQAVQQLQGGDLAGAQQTLGGHDGLALRHEAGLTLLGILHHQRGEWGQALQALDAALEKAPGLAEAHAYRGQALRHLGRPEEALASYDQALSLNPNDAASHCNRGNALADLDRDAEALVAFDEALALSPGEPVALLNRAAALHALERYEEALAAYDSLLTTQPDFAAAHCNRARSLHALEDHEAALAAAERALALRPHYPQALANRGLALRGLGRPEAALAEFDRVIAMRPDSDEAQRQRGQALQELGRFEEALQALEQALALDPASLETKNLLGHGLRLLGRLDEALARYDEVLRQDPEDAVALFGRGVILLQRGDMTAGWQDYEARWRTDDFKGKGPELDAPLWAGEPLAGKRLLVYAEQGLGDCLQFARFLRRIPADGGQVVFWVVPRLMRLLAGALDGIQMLDAKAPLTGDFDYRLPLMSLPRVLGASAESLAAPAPYLRAEPDRVAAWRARIGERGTRVAIGWQGNPKGVVDRGRSIPLHCFAPLAAVPGVRLISLQAQDGLEQLDSLPAGMAVESLGPDFDAGPDAFLDAAAVMECVDLVVVSDSALAHLAGALGRPTWLALKRSPDWRWELERSDTPWYPSLRLFRQASDGDWDGVFAAMAEALAARPASDP